MTNKERKKDCYCYDYSEDSGVLCHVCEEFYDKDTEEYEEHKRERLVEEREY